MVLCTLCKTPDTRFGSRNMLGQFPPQFVDDPQYLSKFSALIYSILCNVGVREVLNKQSAPQILGIEEDVEGCHVTSFQGVA